MRRNPNTLPDASVIIPTRNRAAILDRCLKALARQDLPVERFEIIVIDDASNDETARVLEAAQNRMNNLSSQRFERPDGSQTAFISKTRNMGLRAARGPVVISIDDDCMVPRQFVSGHIAHHARQDSKTAWVVTGPIIDTSDLAEEGQLPPQRGTGWHSNPIPGGNFSALRAPLLDVGGFDEAFTHYGWEDLELYERLRAQGLQRIYDRSLMVWHYKPAQVTVDFPARLRQEIHRGAMGAYFLRKHPRFHVALATKQIGALRWMDAGLNALFGLDRGIEKVLQEGQTPKSWLMRTLLREHAEIAGSRLLPLIETAPR